MFNLIKRYLFLIILTGSINFILITKAFSLSVYKNYSDSDILITKIKIGGFDAQYKSKEDSNLVVNQKGLSFGAEFNPLYGFSVLNNFYLGIYTNLTYNSELKNDSLLLTLNYNIPIKLLLPEWMPNFNIFGGVGYGIQHTKGTYDNIFENINREAKAINLGVELAPKQLIIYKIAFYTECTTLLSKCIITNEVEKKYKQDITTFIKIGIIYKTNYITK